MRNVLFLTLICKQQSSSSSQTACNSHLPNKKMGNVEVKTSFRRAIAELASKSQPIEPSNDVFWQKFWQEEPALTIHDVFALITPADVRSLRECSPRNFVTFCFKLIEQIQLCCKRSVSTDKDRVAVMNCVRLLTRMLPFMFEDDSFRSLMWTAAPPAAGERSQFAAGQSYYNNSQSKKSLETVRENHDADDVELNSDDSPELPPAIAVTLMNCLADLLFCPNLTITITPSSSNSSTTTHHAKKSTASSESVLCDLRETSSDDELSTLDSCEHIWEKGIGCVYSRPQSAVFDSNRSEILRLVLTCFSETLYIRPAAITTAAAGGNRKAAAQSSTANKWIQHWTSSENRHVLPLFTSLINCIFAYDPTKSAFLLPYNHLLFRDCREPLIDVALQVLVVALEDSTTNHHQRRVSLLTNVASIDGGGDAPPLLLLPPSKTVVVNLFISYTSRIHRDEDFHFLLAGFKRLLQNPLHATYLPHAARRVKFHQELLIVLWKLCDINKRFLHYMLKTSEILDIVVPVLYHLCDARQDAARMGLVHVCVFILLLLSGERNFGVRLNKPYTTASRIPMDIALFTGNHGDLLLVVFHRVITTGHSKIQNLFDSLLTIAVNISPYLKSLSMCAANSLLHLFEAFSTPWFLFANATNHHLVFYLLEVFNNIIQYQFDGNANLVYCMIRKRQLFHQLANLPTDSALLDKSSRQSRAKLLSVTTAAAGGDDHERLLKSIVGGARDDEHQAAARQDSLVSTARPAAAQTTTTEATVIVTQATALVDDAMLNVSLTNGSNDNAEQNRKTNENALSRDGENDDSNKNMLNFDDKSSNAGEAPSPSPTTMSPTKLEFLSATPAAIQMTSTSNAHELSDIRFGDGDVCNQHEQKNNSLANADDSASDFAAFADESDVKLTTRKNSSDAKTDSATSDVAAQQARRLSRDAATQNSAQEPSTVPFLQNANMLVGSSSQQRNKPLTPAMRTTSITSAPDPNVAATHAQQQVDSTTPTNKKHPAAALTLWVPTSDWVQGWKSTLPLQTIMRMLQVLVPQVEKICIDRNLTDETDIIKFLKSGTLVGLLPVPHPILIRKYQANVGTNLWFRTYMWGVVYLRNSNPPIWFETKVKLFETSQRTMFSK